MPKPPSLHVPRLHPIPFKSRDCFPSEEAVRTGYEVGSIRSVIFIVRPPFPESSSSRKGDLKVPPL